MDDPYPTPPAADLADAIALAGYAERAYLEYALERRQGPRLARRLRRPEAGAAAHPVRDGAHGPRVHRPPAGAKPVKSARVVGDVLGPLPPARRPGGVRRAGAHGAGLLAALSADRRPGQLRLARRRRRGGDALHRSARLAPIARLLLDEIDEGTVDFIPNYDGSTEEPQAAAGAPAFVLPQRRERHRGRPGAPRCRSHNLREVAAAAVALIKRRQARRRASSPRCIPGPDYPGGGQIISSADEIRAAYASGRGSAQGARALEDRRPGARPVAAAWSPSCRRAPARRRCSRRSRSSPTRRSSAGKKALSAEQTQLKATVLAVLDAVRDESSKDAAVRLVFEPKTSRIEQQDELITHAAGAHQPRELGVDQPDDGRRRRPADAEEPAPDAASSGSPSARDGASGARSHRLGKVLERIHILEGRQLVLLNIDEVIAHHPRTPTSRSRR